VNADSSDPTFPTFLSQLPPGDPKDKATWMEDDFYGRYEITLTVDVGTTDQMLAASKAMREFAATLDVLGYETKAVYVVGGSSHRRPRER
jgi:hypothetical protein